MAACGAAGGQEVRPCRGAENGGSEKKQYRPCRCFGFITRSPYSGVYAELALPFDVYFLAFPEEECCRGNGKGARCVGVLMTAADVADGDATRLLLLFLSSSVLFIGAVLLSFFSFLALLSLCLSLCFACAQL